MAIDDTSKHDPIFHYENGVPVFNPQRIDELAQEQEQAKQRDAKYKEAQLTVNRRLMVFTGVLAACGIIAGGVSAWQAHIANQTLTEIQKSKYDTNRIVTASETQAYAAQKIADAADRNAESAKVFSESAKRLAKASEIANKQNLRFFAEGNRPWLFVAPYEGDKDSNITIQAGVALPIPLIVKNIGKSPAIKVTDLVMFAKVFTDAVEEHKFLTTFIMKIPTSDPRNGIVTTDTPVVTTVTTDHRLTPREAMGLLQTPVATHLVVCGRIEYGTPLSATKPGEMYTEFCYLWYGGFAPGKAHWLPAIYHNEMK